MKYLNLIAFITFGCLTVASVYYERYVWAVINFILILYYLALHKT